MDPAIDPSIQEGTLPFGLERPAVAAHASQDQPYNAAHQSPVAHAGVAHDHLLKQPQSAADATIGHANVSSRAQSA